MNASAEEVVRIRAAIKAAGFRLVYRIEHGGYVLEPLPLVVTITADTSKLDRQLSQAQQLTRARMAVVAAAPEAVRAAGEFARHMEQVRAAFGSAAPRTPVQGSFGGVA